MSNENYKLSGEAEALVSQVFELLKTRIRANPYGWDGAFAEGIRRLPPGLRAMAATHHLDVSRILRSPDAADGGPRL